MNNKDIRLSKSLSWLLRHGAVQEGLNLSPEGYLDVDTVLHHKTFRGYNRCDIERVVRDNEKQRFQLREDPVTRSLQIKANQGHSISAVSDAELTPILTAKYPTIVHGTFAHCWPQIQLSGLSRMRRKHIHFAKSNDTISGLRRNAQIHIYVDLEKALRDGIKFYESDNGVVLTAGNDNGFLEPKYFVRVLQVATGESCHNLPVKLKMEASAAHPVPKVPRPAFTKPPFSRPLFPQNIPMTRPILMNGHLPTLPVPQDHRPMVQHHRPLIQDQRPLIQDRRPVTQEYRAMSAEHRPMHNERRAAQGAGGRPAQQGGRGAQQARDNWRRRRAERPAPPVQPPAQAGPRDDSVYSRMVQAVGFPGYTRPQDLIHAFSEFGVAKVERIIGNTAAIMFNHPEEAAAAVRASTTVCLYGEFLTVKPYTKALENQRVNRHHRGEMDKSKPKGPTVDPMTITWDGDFHAQLDALLTAVRLSQHEIQQLATLYQDLETVLQPAWPGCLTIPFGSVTTGLGVKASDADCFVLLPGGAGAGGGAARAQAVPKARRLLAHHPHIFSSLIAIPNANTPIVKFFHLPTRTHCDVSFKTLLGVQNSKLINFLLYADPRLLPLAVVVKYWAAVHELSGTGKLTNYALTMLLIFYLQQPEAILPPVAWLQRDRATDYIVDGWNTGFMNDRDRLPPTNNTSSIADLIGGFFQFYTQFNFADLVVCPYLGHAVKKDTFKDLNQLPAEFERYKTNVTAGVVLPIRFNTTMCVQDPFEQCHNVASPVTSRLAADIRAYFKFAAEAYEKDKPNGCKNFLGKILLEKPKLPRAKGKTEIRVNVYSNTLINITAPDWRSAAKEVVHSIFHTILKLNLEPVVRDASDTEETAAPGSQQKNREKIKYTGVLTRAIWKRKQFTKLYSAMKLKFLEKETKITEEIMTTDNNVIDIPFQLNVTYVNSPRTVILALRPGAGDLQTFKEFGKFFQSVMLQWFQVLSRPYCEKPEKKEKPQAPAAGKKAAAANVPPPAEELDTRETEELSNSDSDSDASTEDERIPPDAQAESVEPDTNETQSDSEKAPSYANKENIEETNNVNSNKSASTNQTQNSKTQKNIGQSHKDITKDALKNPSVDECERRKSEENSNQRH